MLKGRNNWGQIKYFELLSVEKLPTGYDNNSVAIGKNELNLKDINTYFYHINSG